MPAYFNPDDLNSLYTPRAESHKGQNGKLLLIGGSKLFHAASLWSLNVASRIVDMVFYASVPENNAIVKEIKKEFLDGIVISRSEIGSYIEEADAVLLGPGMVRRDKDFEINREMTLEEINLLEDEGMQTYFLTRFLLKKYPGKKWILDAGALQMMEKEWLKDLPQVILTPHLKEFERLFGLPANLENAENMAKEYQATILLKGREDIVCSRERCVLVSGGNAGMTKGGTGDVLAGLVAALACKNDLFLAAAAGSYFNKKAGDALFSRVGTTFNSSDLAQEIPLVMKAF